MSTADFKRGVFAIAISEKKDVQGFVHASGLFGIHDHIRNDKPVTVVTHIPTGRRLGVVSSVADAARLVDELLALGPSNFVGTDVLDNMSDELKEKAAAIVSKYASRVATRPHLTLVPPPDPEQEPPPTSTPKDTFH